MAYPHSYNSSNSVEAERLSDALNGHRVGNHYEAHCPAHNDRHPSLHIAQRDGKVLVKCWAGCSQATVIDALKKRHLWGRGRGPA